MKQRGVLIESASGQSSNINRGLMADGILDAEYRIWMFSRLRELGGHATQNEGFRTSPPKGT